MICWLVNIRSLVFTSPALYYSIVVYIHIHNVSPCIFFQFFQMLPINY